MKTESRLQFSRFGRGLARATAWVAVTMALGLILVIMFGSPLAASTTESTLPGKHDIKEKTGPWVYRNISIHV